MQRDAFMSPVGIDEERNGGFESVIRATIMLYLFIISEILD